MAKFKVGDVCILINCESFPELKGCQLTITSNPIQCFDDIRGAIWIGYDTDLICPDGIPLAPSEDQLRLKKFPGEEKVMKLFIEVTKPDVVPA